MKPVVSLLQSSAVVAALLVFSSCGGTPAAFRIGGTVAGLTSAGLVLQNDNTNFLSVSADGSFAFAGTVASGTAYDVTIQRQPEGQTCTVGHGSGVVAGADVTDVSVTCTSRSFTVGGVVLGLAGTGLTLQNDGGDSLGVSANGAFTFASPVASGASFAVTVSTQPASPAQTCTVTNGTGRVGGEDVSTVVVLCSTNTYTVGGTVAGLVGTIVLENNGTDFLSVSADGPFTFATALPSGGHFDVAVQAQPADPMETCTVSAAGAGTISGSNVSSVEVTCAMKTFRLGGTVSGLVGSGLVLQTGAGDVVVVSADGAFSFPTPVPSHSSYAVTVKAQPSSPSQTCTVQAGAGTVGSADINSVGVTCTTNRYAVGGTITGLVGATLVLQNNGTEVISVSASGAFVFPTTIVSGNSYSVTMQAQPTGQFCEVANGSGTVTSAAVASVAVTCRGWTWMGGPNTAGASGVYGTKGTASPGNVPGARTGFAQWRDRSGNLWVFGGAGFDSSGARSILSDLWKFDGSNWTWVSGPNLGGSRGVFGTKGTAAPGNSPGARQSAVLWGDAQGRIWLFGGRGLDSTGTNGYLNDLWKFDGVSWTWVGGANTADASGIYGTRGTASATNAPGGRAYGVSCGGSGGTLWLFGGLGVDSTGNLSMLNDLWKFDGTSWTWVSGADGSSTGGSALGVYGTKGTAAAANVPGARMGASGWVDSSGTFWLFGGQVAAPANPPEGGNDLWKFDGTNWTWVAGMAVSGSGVTKSGVYGARGVAAAGNTPGERREAAAWADASGHLWLFGGGGADSTGNGGYLDDLWRFDGSNWTWVLGSNVAGEAAAYGTMGVPAGTNAPGARSGAGGWMDAQGRFWLFGGVGVAPAGAPPSMLNDVWRY